MTQYQPGTKHGAYEVIAIVGKDKHGNVLLRARCLSCSSETDIGANALRQSRLNRSEYCGQCYHKRCQFVARTGKLCPKCGNMPWRRPLAGACKCGKTYAPEVVQPIEVMHSNGAIDSPGLICVDWR